jgi:hypothetical protein
MLHYLRIAVTALCLTVCVLLTVFWVRSTYTLDHFIQVWHTAYLRIWSCQGKVLINVDEIMTVVPIGDTVARERIRTSMADLAKAQAAVIRQSQRCPISETNWIGFRWSDSGIFVVPYWFLVSMSGSIAAAPWLRVSRRFSLRTLLIATTLVAVVLSLVVISR